MRFPHRREGVSAECDMTPMIDMTFQLITFFMMALSFSEADQNERINLPSSEMAKPSVATNDIPITLQLTKEGTVIYAGEDIPLIRMASILRREKDSIERGLYGKRKVADATIILRADAVARTGDVQKLISLCQNAQFQKFVLRAMQEEIKGGL